LSGETRFEVSKGFFLDQLGVGKGGERKEKSARVERKESEFRMNEEERLTSS